MQPSGFKRSSRVVITLVRWLLVVCLVAVTVSALSNLGLPTHSQVVDRLSDVDQARLSEMVHLRQTLGGAVWPGWSQAEIPVIVYNEAYAFLIGYPDPPAGWLKMPQRIARGGAWEPVPDDTFEGRPYFRQRLIDPNVTPQSFTVLVGDRWVATFATKEYAQIDFVHGLRANLPPVVRSVFPYRLAWRWLMGESEDYIGALEHEAFHAYQGQVAPARLAGAEAAMQQDSLYPWDDRALGAMWQHEVNLLADAAQAPSEVEAAALARHFLAQRDARRAQSELGPALVDYERQREWLEGLAKYAELALGRVAATIPDYQPVPAIASDPDFGHYTRRERFWSLQLDELRRLSSRSGETRFYYTGAAQAAVLDQLMPAWKAQILKTDMALEDMLRAAVIGHTVQGERR